MPKCPKDCKKKSCIFFRTINIPAIVANDEEVPPKNGEYCNALVVYEATGNAYFFPSDGIPTLLSAANYALLKNLPSINGVTVVGDLTLSDIGVTQLVEEEADARAASDNVLQEQIDAIVASSDVVDIVGTYEELEEYDTSHLTVNDVIKVISDETEGGATTYYRWTGSAWGYIGAEGPYYTTAQIDSMLDEKLDVDALNDYYDKAEVDALLADKADSSDLAGKQDKLVAGANITIDPATNVISATMPSLANYYTKQETYSQNEVDSLISGVEAQIPTNTSDLNNDSGFLTSIPTASASVLGGVKIGSGLSIDQSGVLSATGTSMTIDSALSTTSANPVENRVITNALNSKADVSAIPVVPTNVSAFYNDAGYVTSSTIASNYYNKTETYTQNEVDGLISGVSASIPTKTSDLTNDSGFITSASLPTKTSDLVNDGSDNTSTYVEADELATVATSGSYNDLSDKPSIMSGLVEMSYGESNAWAKFIAAYRAGQIVYCRASSNSNPATGTQGRKAFMAYVNNAENPTEVEFQYVRSVSTKTASQPVDQVYVYKLTNANGGTWTVQTRNMAPKVAQGTNTTVSYSNGTYTISATQPTVPTKTSDLTNDGSDGTSTYVEADELPRKLHVSIDYGDPSNWYGSSAGNIGLDFGWDKQSSTGYQIIAMSIHSPVFTDGQTSQTYTADEIIGLLDAGTDVIIDNAPLGFYDEDAGVETITVTPVNGLSFSANFPNPSYQSSLIYTGSASLLLNIRDAFVPLSFALMGSIPIENPGPGEESSFPSQFIMQGLYYRSPSA